MARKKILFVIVEGPSDDDALGVILNRIYDKNFVHVHIMHGDITTQSSVTPENIVAKIGGLVRTYADRKFKPNDFRQIIHITDTDGAFIPNESIIEDSQMSHPFYLTTEIRTNQKFRIEARNFQKQANLNRLVQLTSVWKVPYQIYYMSCNLDHVLYNKLNSSDEEKEYNSLAFARKYQNDIPSFLEFISNSEFSVAGNYKASWEFIRQGLHSLERHTNFGLCFESNENA